MWRELSAGLAICYASRARRRRRRLSKYGRHVGSKAFTFRRTRRCLQMAGSPPKRDGLPASSIGAPFGSGEHPLSTAASRKVLLLNPTASFIGVPAYGPAPQRFPDPRLTRGNPAVEPRPLRDAHTSSRADSVRLPNSAASRSRHRRAIPPATRRYRRRGQGRPTRSSWPLLVRISLRENRR